MRKLVAFWLLILALLIPAVVRSFDLDDFIESTVVPFLNWDGKPSPEPVGAGWHVAK